MVESVSSVCRVQGLRDCTVLVIDVGPSMHKALPEIERFGSMLVQKKTDVFLALQIAIATARFNVNMSTFPSLNRVNETYKSLPEFQASSPDRQPDAVHRH